MRTGSDLFPSERRSLRRFLTIYIGSSLFLIAAGSSIFYQSAYRRLIDHQNDTLKLKTETIKPRLRRLHNSLAPTLRYPVIEGIKTALYDIDGRYLIGQLPPKPLRNAEFWQEGETLYYRTYNQPYYLGAATIVAAAKLDKTPIRNLQIKLLLSFGAATLFIALVARWLGRLFLAPVHQTMAMLDRFIKDSTHELNTPVSTILTNIELFKELHPQFADNRELERIEIASRRLSRIYDDLAYLQLNHRRHRRLENIDMSELVSQRLNYFSPLAKRRGVTVRSKIQEGVKLTMDKEDATRLVDNLLSNAIKYTPPGGRIALDLHPRGMRIEDTGKGMDEKTLQRATERFFRADGSEGGFGLGLNIVAEIVAYYGLDFHIESQPGRGTKVSLRW